jgi:hypothetical protein
MFLLLRWFGLSLSVGVAILFVTSLIVPLQYRGESIGLALVGGAVSIESHNPALRLSGWLQNPVRSPIRWLPSSCFGGESDASGQIYYVTCRQWWLPLWLPFILVALPTELLWWYHRRSPAPGHCHACGYDLTGNQSGICSECGTRIGERVLIKGAKVRMWAMFSGVQGLTVGAAWFWTIPEAEHLTPRAVVVSQLLFLLLLLTPVAGLVWSRLYLGRRPGWLFG